MNVSLDEHRLGGLRWIVLRGPTPGQLQQRMPALAGSGCAARDGRLTLRSLAAGLTLVHRTATGGAPQREEKFR